MKTPSFPSVSDEASEQIVSEWLEIIKRQECGIISFPPRGGAYRRIQHLLTWKRILNKYLGKTYRSISLNDISVLDIAKVTTSELAALFLKRLGVSKEVHISTAEEFVRTIQPLLCKYKSVTFFLYDTDEWFRGSRIDLMTFFSKIAELDSRIQFLLFCEMDVASPVFLKLNLGTTTLTQNIVTVPLYDETAIRHFILQLAVFWKIRIPDTITQKIIDQVGCHIWLIKEAVRIYIKDGKIPESFVTKPTIRFKLETIWQQLTLTEQQVLSKVVDAHGQFSYEEKTSLQHLAEIGFIKNVIGKWKVTIPLFIEFLKEKQESRVLSVSETGEVLLDSEIVSNRFGQLEKSALICLIQKKGDLVKRDELGECIWKTKQETYTEWALDRLVSRLRKKIRLLGIDPNRLKTVKKVGWVWQV